MIGLRQLASLLAGAVVLFGSVLVPAGEEGAVAVETTETGATRALAQQPARLDLGELEVYDLVTSRGAPTPPDQLEGGFETVRFMASATDGSHAATLGGEDVPVPAGSQVLVEGLSGAISVEPTDAGVSLVLTGTAKSLQVEPPQAPSVDAYHGARSSIPVRNLTIGGQAVDGAVEQAGQFSELAFTVEPPEGPGSKPATVTEGSEAFPIRHSARVRVADFAGVVVAAEAGQSHLSLELDGFGNVTVAGETLVDREVHEGVSANASVEGPTEPPEANFTHDPSAPEAGETVQFRSQSTNDTVIRSWDWRFGDGTTSQARTPEHVYDDDGTFLVSLTVTDALGRQDTVNRTIRVVNSRPVVQLDWEPSRVVEGEQVALIADASDRDGDIESYEWSIPNRSAVAGPEVNHTFARQGSHEVEVVVTDAEGAQARARETIQVRNAAPTVNFTVDPSPPTAREPTLLESTSEDYGDGEIVAYRWEISSVGDREGEVVETAFNRDGNQTVELTVVDDDGARANLTRRIGVRNPAPDAEIEIRPRPPNPGETATFTAGVTDDDPIQEAVWTFSDGVRLEGLQVSRAFDEGGVYDVELVLEDADGANATVTRTFEVNHAPEVALGPEGQSATDEVAVHTGEEFTITARAHDPDGNVTGFSWRIDSAEPEARTECVLAPDGNESRLTCSWPDDGTHKIRVQARDDDGATTTTELHVLVLNRAPSLNPDVLTDLVNEDELVNLQANAHDPDGQVEEIVWFVDGIRVGVGDRIAHRFTEHGEHEVRANATDDDGAVETAAFTVDVNARPTVDASFSPAEPLAGETVSFSASAADPDGDDTNLSVEWTFGDGANATGAQASHTYDEGGTYVVEVAVTDEVGGTSAEQFRLDVDTPPLGADLDVSPQPPRVDSEATFTVDVRDGREVEQIEWSFGDGASQTTGEGVTSVSHTYDEPETFRLTVEIDADHGETRRLSADVRVTGDTPYELVLEPGLPNGQCLNLDHDNVTVEATNLATARTVNLEDGDGVWSRSGECTVRHAFGPGTWSVGDRLSVELGAGPAQSTHVLRIEGPSPLVDRGVNLLQAPLAFTRMDLVSPGQDPVGEHNSTYRDPAAPVFLVAQAEWVEGTPVRDLPVNITTTYRGPNGVQGPSLQYHDATPRIPSDGLLRFEVPAPVLAAEPGATDSGSVGPSLVYAPGQYTVRGQLSSGLYGDLHTRSFVEDPAGIFAELDQP